VDGAAAGGRSLVKVAPVTAKRCHGSFGRGITSAFEGFRLQLRGDIAASGAYSGRGGGRDDEGALGRLEAAGRGHWAALTVELKPWLEFCFSHPAFV